ncbi:MAG TPA: four helix bundle protein [Candidatus Bacteroides merdavium]|uniref:Four helix bundle protein n=1 Tax=Candidatus Bacteroides merdavium TaxID=2838472 RepID=A0A9D2KE75_9BACE|nr:four helix bundle protein [Candidatus Bacteroides merdavium]
MKTDNVVKDKSMAFSLRVIKASRFLTEERNEHILSKQLLRSGTAIGALIREAEFAESKKDFVHKLTIALKETNETEYWLILLKESDYISSESFDSIIMDCRELMKLLISIIKSSKQRD